MMLEKMKNFVKKKNICVLSTISGNKPYCSLMAYITDETCKEVYMVTHKNTTKFNNLQKNPWVSLLIDSRETTTQIQRSGVDHYRCFCSPFSMRAKNKKFEKTCWKSFPHMKRVHPPSGIRAYPYKNKLTFTFGRLDRITFCVSERSLKW